MTKFAISRQTYKIFLSAAVFFSKSTFSKNSFKNNVKMSNSLDSDQARHKSA